jgi:hypothetical protein
LEIAFLISKLCLFLFAHLFATSWVLRYWAFDLVRTGLSILLKHSHLQGSIQGVSISSASSAYCEFGA